MAALRNDFFISYLADAAAVATVGAGARGDNDDDGGKAESGLATALKSLLEAAGRRFFPNGISVYLDASSSNISSSTSSSPAAPAAAAGAAAAAATSSSTTTTTTTTATTAAEGSDAAAKTGPAQSGEDKAGLECLAASSAVVFLFSQKSWNALVNNLKKGAEDRTMKEIQLAIDLKKTIIPLCVKPENGTDYFYLYRQDLSSLTGPQFEGLKQAVRAINSIQMIEIDSANPQTRVYRILSVLFPAHFSPTSLAGVPVPSKVLRPDSALLRGVASSLASAGHCIVHGPSGLGKSTLAQIYIQFATAKRHADAATGGPDVFFSTTMYERVVWVDCRSAESAMGSLRTAFKGAAANDDETVAAAWKALWTSKARFLVVLDGVDDDAVVDSIFADLVKPAAAAAADRPVVVLGGDYLITTTRETLGGRFHAALMERSTTTTTTTTQELLKIDLWSKEDTTAYVLQRCPHLKTIGASTPYVESLVNTLGGNPSVIEQFVAYYNHLKPPLSEMETRFKAVLAKAERQRK